MLEVWEIFHFWTEGVGLPVCDFLQKSKVLKRLNLVCSRVASAFNVERNKFLVWNLKRLNFLNTFEFCKKSFVKMSQ